MFAQKEGIRKRYKNNLRPTPQTFNTPADCGVTIKTKIKFYPKEGGGSKRVIKK